jgi:hypothetical protein
MIANTSTELEIGNRAQTHVNSYEPHAPQITLKTGQGKPHIASIVRADLQRHIARSNLGDRLDRQGPLLRPSRPRHGKNKRRDEVESVTHQTIIKVRPAADTSQVTARDWHHDGR